LIDGIKPGFCFKVERNVAEIAAGTEKKRVGKRAFGKRGLSKPVIIVR